MLCHVLERLGDTNVLYFGIIRELHRVCKAGARITKTVLTAAKSAQCEMQDQPGTLERSASVG